MTSTKFILLGGQRTGTTFINDCLGSHPEIACLNELFTLNRVADDCYATWMRCSFLRRVSHLVLRHRNVHDFLDETFRNRSENCVGFKFMYGQARYMPYRFPHVLQYAREKDLKLVHVIRQNHLRTLVSRITAANSRVYHATEKVNVGRIRLDPERLVAALEHLRREDARWRQIASRFNHVTVHYEEFVSSKQAESDRICSCLGVTGTVELQSALVKINPSALEDVIENFHDVEEKLNNSKFEFCLRS